MLTHDIGLAALVQIAALQEGCCITGESAEGIHQDAAWIGEEFHQNL